MEEVGDLQEAFRDVENRRVLLLHYHQLIQGVKLHKLQAGLRENLVAGNGLKRPFHRAVGSRVAVTIRVPEQFAAAPEEREVDAPCVDADARNFRAVFRPDRAQAVLDVFPEPRQVPVKRPVHIDRPVFVPIKLFQLDFLPVEMSDNVSSARRAHIDRQIRFFHVNPFNANNLPNSKIRRNPASADAQTPPEAVSPLYL